MALFQHIREFLGDLQDPEYNLDVTENKHYWVLKDDSEVVEDLARAYLEGEDLSFDFEPINTSEDYQVLVDEVENMVAAHLGNLEDISDIDGYGYLEMGKSTTEYLKWKILDEIEIVENSEGYKLVLEPERNDELDLMESTAFS